MQQEKTVLVIGAGLSGVLTAVHLLRDGIGEPLQVILVNRTGAMARGLAYGTRSEQHLLNVPAGRMSAFTDDEESFLRYARTADPNIQGGTFVPRRLYGDYLEHILRDAELNAAQGASLKRVVGEAIDLTSIDNGKRANVLMRDGTEIIADIVVLALGNFPPADPPIETPEFFASPYYVRDPWGPQVLERIRSDLPVLLIGTGLTMYDVVLRLDASGFRQPIWAISRRGLTPMQHRTATAPPKFEQCPPEILTGEPTIAAYLKAVRNHVRLLAKHGVDWREVVGSLRPVTAKLWQRLPDVERLRFLRHLQPFWDVHRHRTAPEIHNRIIELKESDRLKVLGGRIASLKETQEGIVVEFRTRSTGLVQKVIVGGVINCTGPQMRIKSVPDAFVQSLLSKGWLKADSLDLGIEMDDRHALVSTSGEPSPILFHVGPLLRAKYWEATAVPELRVHAANMAKTIRSDLTANRN